MIMKNLYIPREYISGKMIVWSSIGRRDGKKICHEKVLCIIYMSNKFYLETTYFCK